MRPPLDTVPSSIAALSCDLFSIRFVPFPGPHCRMYLTAKSLFLGHDLHHRLDSFSPIPFPQYQDSQTLSRLILGAIFFPRGRKTFSFFLFFWSFQHTLLPLEGPVEKKSFLEPTLFPSHNDFSSLLPFSSSSEGLVYDSTEFCLWTFFGVLFIPVRRPPRIYPPRRFSCWATPTQQIGSYNARRKCCLKMLSSRVPRPPCGAFAHSLSSVAFSFWRQVLPVSLWVPTGRIFFCNFLGRPPRFYPLDPVRK